MISVTPNGARVVEIARAIVSQAPCASVAPLLRAKANIAGVGAGAMRLFEEALAKGCVRALARLGGWRRVHRLGPGGPRPRRLWEDRPAPELSFSPYPFELCRWLASEPMDEERTPSLFTRAPETAADELFAYLACAMFEGEWVEPLAAAQPGLRRSALARLGFPRMLAPDDATDVARLVRAGDFVLDALQDDLARRAVAFERFKAALRDPSELRDVCRAREADLDALVDACEAAGRWDLASFVAEAAVAIIGMPTISRLDPISSLRARSEARRAAGAHLRVLGRLAKRHEAARVAHFTDEDFDAAQLVLARWERLGNHGFSRAADVLAGLEALDGG